MKLFFAILLMTGTAMAETETIQCYKSRTTTFYTFEAPTIPPGDALVEENEVRESGCSLTTRFHGDGRIGIAAYSKGPEQRDPGSCWKEIARNQLDGAKCCFDTLKGNLNRPWQHCGVIGIPEKEKAAKRAYIRKLSQSL